ncbi:hypothetical protein cypCar_00042327 [Cyprinus carpio]|nr:hypothetical protein cypCar_00042327 [Cyprinus carpio]
MAALGVLENFSDAPMTPKQILHVIQTKGLKEMSGTAPLACLVTMLHSQVRGDRVKNSIFFKLPGRMSLFTLKDSYKVLKVLKDFMKFKSWKTLENGHIFEKPLWMRLPPVPLAPQNHRQGSVAPHRETEEESCDDASCSAHSSQGPMKRNRGGVEVDFETPGSILVNTNIRALINTRTFAAFPPHSQQQLLQLLPEVDRQVGPDGLARLSSSALNNEFFTHASQSWKERLAEGEFTHEMQVRFRQEMEKEKKVEAWKEKFFEEYHGQSGYTQEAKCWKKTEGRPYQTAFTS